MAYDFVAASSQYLSASSAPVTDAPLTMAIRANPNSIEGGTSYFVYNIGNATANHAFLIYTNGGGVTFWVSGQQISTNWQTGFQSLVAVAASSTSRTMYRNETASTTQTTSSTPSGVNRLGIGAQIYNNAAGVSPMNGKLAEAAIWNTNLTNAEITSLSKGFKPSRIRPQSLVFYAPLIRNLQDTKGGLALTNNNTATVTDHPRVY